MTQSRSRTVRRHQGMPFQDGKLDFACGEAAMNYSHLLCKGIASLTIVLLVLPQAGEYGRRKNTAAIAALDTVQEIERQTAGIKPGQHPAPVAGGETLQIRDDAVFVKPQELNDLLCQAIRHPHASRSGACAIQPQRRSRRTMAESLVPLRAPSATASFEELTSVPGQGLRPRQMRSRAQGSGRMRRTSAHPRSETTTRHVLIPLRESRFRPIRVLPVWSSRWQTPASVLQAPPRSAMPS